MKRIHIILLLGLGLLVLNACTPKSTVTPMPAETKSTATLVAAIPTQPVALEPVINNCVTCHTDKDMLIQTAAPEEVASESESEGVG